MQWYSGATSQICVPNDSVTQPKKQETPQMLYSKALARGRWRGYGVGMAWSDIVCFYPLKEPRNSKSIATTVDKRCTVMNRPQELLQRKAHEFLNRRIYRTEATPTTNRPLEVPNC